MIELSGLADYAIHEAGHAAVATNLGLKVESIMLHWTHDASALNVAHEGGEVRVSRSGPPLTQVAIAVAGWAGLTFWHPELDLLNAFLNGQHNRSPKDLSDANEWLDKLEPAPTVKQRREHLVRQWGKCCGIMRPTRRLKGIERLANAIMDRYKLKHDEAVEVGLDHVGLIRAVISGEKLDALLEFAK